MQEKRKGLCFLEHQHARQHISKKKSSKENGREENASDMQSSRQRLVFSPFSGSQSLLIVELHRSSFVWLEFGGVLHEHSPAPYSLTSGPLMHTHKHIHSLMHRDL